MTPVPRMTVVASVAGSLLYAMANYVAIARSPKKLTPEERVVAVRGAILDGVFALVAGVIGGWYAAPAVVSYYHIVDVQLISFIGLLTGMVFWKVIPGVIIWAVAWVGRLTGGKP